MATIGEQFKAAREAKGISQVDAGNATKTLTKVIAAMEENDFSGMAAPAYAKGFIRLYAEFLELDSEPLVEQYLREHASSPPRLIDEHSQLQKNSKMTRSLPRLPGLPTLQKPALPDWAGPLGKTILEKIKSIPLGPLRDIRVAAGILAGILVLIALISSISTCAHRAPADAPPHKPVSPASPARTLLDEPLPDLYYTAPGKIETNLPKDEE